MSGKQRVVELGSESERQEQMDLLLNMLWECVITHQEARNVDVNRPCLWLDDVMGVNKRAKLCKPWRVSSKSCGRRWINSHCIVYTSTVARIKKARWRKCSGTCEVALGEKFKKIVRQAMAPDRKNVWKGKGLAVQEALGGARII